MNGLMDVRAEGGVTRWTLRRAKTRNAVDYEVMEAFEGALKDVEANSSTVVLLFSTEGSHFMSGGDLRAFAHLTTAEGGRAMADRMKAILDRIERLPCITVALVDGDAYGGGCETALAFDQIWMSATARMGFTQANFALNPGWGGHLRLMERVGAHRALHWQANRTLVGAEEARLAGLAEQVLEGDDIEAKVSEALGRMLETEPAVLRALKRVKQAYCTGRDSGLAALEADLFAELWGAETHTRRVQAFLARARPEEKAG